MKTLLLLLWLSNPCLPAGRALPADETTPLVRGDLIEGDTELPEGHSALIRIKGDAPYTITPKPKEVWPLRDDEGNRVLIIRDTVPPGYTITVNHAITHPTDEEIESAPWDDREKFSKWLEEHRRDEIYRDEHFVKVGEPDPDDDDTDPDDGDDDDDDDTAPIPEEGFRVLIFYEKDETLPSLQQAILAGEEVANYLNETCAEEPSGTAAYRIYDDDADLSGELPVWKKAFQRRPQELPWVIISNGTSGTEQPLPKTPSEFIELCREYEK